MKTFLMDKYLYSFRWLEMYNHLSFEKQVQQLLISPCLKSILVLEELLNGVGNMMNYYEYTNSNNWTGGYYELSIEFHPVGNNKSINNALMALQNCHFFNGIWQERENLQRKTISLPIKIENDSVNTFYGTVFISDEISLPCVITIIRTEEESDWLDIAIPQAIFEKIYPYKYPLTKELNPWLEKVDDVLIKLAEMIYKHSPFELAIIGEEISGYTNQQDITVECLDRITCIIPIELQNRLGVRGKGQGLSNQLRVY